MNARPKVIMSHFSQDLARNRLPNLWEVLSRQTKAPVDLYSFYIYMRDTQRAVDYLDFWYVSSISDPLS